MALFQACLSPVDYLQMCSSNLSKNINLSYPFLTPFSHMKMSRTIASNFLSLPIIQNTSRD